MEPQDLNFQSLSTLYLNENSAGVVIYCHVYLHPYNKYLEVDLIGSKATNRKQEEFFLASARG